MNEVLQFLLTKLTIQQGIRWAEEHPEFFDSVPSVVGPIADSFESRHRCAERIRQAESALHDADTALVELLDSLDPTEQASLRTLDAAHGHQADAATAAMELAYPERLTVVASLDVLRRAMTYAAAMPADRVDWQAWLEGCDSLTAEALVEVAELQVGGPGTMIAEAAACALKVCSVLAALHRVPESERSGIATLAAVAPEIRLSQRAL
jgi:hypothetical protein